MKTQLIDFTQWDDHISMCFARALRSNDYAIVGDIPTSTNYPEGLFDYLIKKETYSYILGEGSTYYYYFIRVEIEKDSYVDVPIGVFGSSNSHKINYPLLGNAFLQDFFKMGKAEVGELTEVEEEDLLEELYNNFLKVRIELTKRIFEYYSTVGEGFNSIMSWKIRNKQSITRQVAEAIPYFRHEIENMEYYTFKELNESKSDFFKQCYFRWKELDSNPSHSNASYKYTNNKNFNFQAFFKELVVVENTVLK